MINPIRRIGEQFIDYILTHAPQISRREAYDLAIKMLDDVRMPNPDNVMRSYPFELSGDAPACRYSSGDDLQPETAFG